MLRSEFENLTGTYPSEVMYSVVEKFYYESNMDKRGFCADYAANTDCLAERIQTEANKLEQAREQGFASRIGSMEAQLEEAQKKADMLRLQLDKELDWKPAERTGTNMSQSDYDKLADMRYSCLTDEQAKDMISEMFGFIFNLIEIRHHAETFEVNKHCRLRVKETYQREPHYAATDWNYIRFDCAGCQWELVNGALLPYED